jgi:hypothetical protein
MVNVAVQPPFQAQAGVSLYPPVVIKSRMRAGAGRKGDTTALFAMAILLDADGQVLDGQLGGSQAVTGAEIQDGRRTATFFSFDNRTVACPGTYSIRVDIYQVDCDRPYDATLMEQVETRSFEVFDEEVPAGKPSKSSQPKSLGHGQKL